MPVVPASAPTISPSQPFSLLRTVQLERAWQESLSTVSADCVASVCGACREIWRRPSVELEEDGCEPRSVQSSIGYGAGITNDSCSGGVSVPYGSQRILQNFQGMQHDVLQRQASLNISSYDLFTQHHGIECAMFPVLYPLTEFTDTGILKHLPKST